MAGHCKELALLAVDLLELGAGTLHLFAHAALLERAGRDLLDHRLEDERGDADAADEHLQLDRRIQCPGWTAITTAAMKNANTSCAIESRRERNGNDAPAHT